MNQYLTVSRHKNCIYSKEVDQDSKTIYLKKITKYPFRFFGPSKEKTGWIDVKGKPLKEINADSVADFRNKTKSVLEYGYTLYGTDKLEYQYIYEEFKDVIPKNDLIISGFFDIETARDEITGYSSPAEAKNEIISISLVVKDKIYYWGMKDLSSEFCKKLNFEYFRFMNEDEMLVHFANFISNSGITVLSGWNIVQYDIPYFMNRMNNLEIDRTKISPFGKVFERMFKDSFGNDVQTFNIVGIEILDYLDLYKKFTYVTRDNYKLNTIARVELHEEKVDYSEERNLQELYENDFYKFTEYNIKDSLLVKRLDEKLKLIDLCVTIAYKANVNFADALGTVKMWQFYLYKEMLNQYMVPPMKPQNTDDSSIIGAFVKDPLIGMHEWIVSFDLASLYPHNQIGCNISPDTLLDDDELPGEIIDFRKKIWSECQTLEKIIELLSEKKIDLSVLKKYDIGMTPNIQFYKRDKQGFIPEILHKVYDDLSKAKKKMLLKKQELENLKAEYKHYEN